MTLIQSIPWKKPASTLSDCQVAGCCSSSIHNCFCTQSGKEASGNLRAVKLKPKTLLWTLRKRNTELTWPGAFGKMKYLNPDAICSSGEAFSPGMVSNLVSSSLQ